MCELNNTSRFPNLNLEVSLQDTRTLGCKPSRAKISEEWFSNTDKCQTSSNLPTQNSDSLSDIEIFQESPLEEVSMQEFKSSNSDNEAFEAKMEVQRKVLLETFDNQMTKKMEEMDQKISKRWEEAVAKMHEKYDQKVENYNEAIKDIQTKKEENSQKRKLQLEQQFNEKYQNEYLEKLEALNENFQKENSEKVLSIICEVKGELEMDYQEKYGLQMQTKLKEIKQETEKLKKEQYNEIFKVELAMDLDKKLKTASEIAIADLSNQNQREIAALKKNIRDLEQGHAYEKIKSELLEEMRREYIVKEDEMNKQLKEKLTVSKKEAEDLIERQKTRRLSQEHLDTATEKKEIGLKTRDNSRVRKAEEVNKDLEKKFMEREEKYLKTVEELKKELDELKLSHNIPLSGRLSARNTSSEQRTKTSTYQRNSSKSTEKLRRSCESSFTELSGTKTIGEGTSKSINTRSRRASCTSEKKNANKVADKNTSDLIKSSEIKKNLNDVLMKESMPLQHSSSLGQYYQPFSTERTSKALLQMQILSPSMSSDLHYLQADTGLESMQGPISELTKNTIIEESCEAKETEIKSKPEEVVVTPPKSHHQRSNSGMLSERGRGMTRVEKEVPSLLEDALKQRDTNFQMRRASFTERKQTERSNKNTERVYTTRYEELLNRQRSGSKKRGNSISHKKENMAGLNDKSSKKQGATTRRNFDNQETERKYSAKNVLRNIFEIRDNDDEETKIMKKLKKSVEEHISENDLLASKCYKKEVDLCINIPYKTSVQSADQEKILQDKLKTLFELWKAVEISNVAKLAFMEDLERLIRYDDILQKVSTEINHIAQLATETEPITKLLTWRGQLRDQIKGTDFSHDLYEKLCLALEKNNKELREALEFYQQENGKLVQFKGVDLREIIKVDHWESEYLRNTQASVEY